VVRAAESFGVVGDASNESHGDHVPQRGDRIRRVRAGMPVSGTVYYSDQLQILVKWDDGRSSSLRVGRDEFRIVGDKAAAA
jgi:hypothetical protein